MITIDQAMRGVVTLSIQKSCHIFRLERESAQELPLRSLWTAEKNGFLHCGKTRLCR